MILKLLKHCNVLFLYSNKGSGLKRKYVYEAITHLPLQKMREAAMNYFPDHTEHDFEVFWKQFERKFKKSQQKRERFEGEHAEWLEGFAIKPTSETLQPGRPIKTFEECSDRSKRRLTENIRANYSADQLSYAAQMKMRADHRHDAANLIKNVIDPNNNLALISPEKALSVVVKAKLTKHAYNVVREPVQDRFVIFRRKKKLDKFYLPFLQISTLLPSTKCENEMLSTKKRIYCHRKQCQN